MSNNTTEHPFAEFIRILGKGKNGSRPLTQDEANRAMRMILAGEVEEIQLGAFLMLMRVKEETAEELAGFVLAVRETLPNIASQTADLDWSAYAGKRRHLPWFILSSLLLSENDIKVLMHGSAAHSASRVFAQDMLPLFSLAKANSFAEAEGQLQVRNFAYLSLEQFCPALNSMIHLRNLMGLRSPVHTLVRLVNPLNAPYSIQGIFHPGYRPVHQEAALLLKQAHMTVIKGEGGETERNPDMQCLAQSVHAGELSEEIWPALFPRRHVKPKILEPEQLIQLWRGEINDEFAEASIIGTTAVALKLMAKAESREAAQLLATNYWQKRDKNSY
ncbi:MAG: glycosyl transferase family protein [Gammaproteobacteria bacterium]|jgi:anthranilate phosphoribosyltransferase|nr:glycosyl transferase family protein [Gammaproteobacteria bacterium]MBT5967424.1 glycosyl transferase family protein [Gammaproteobacteria bacterium]MBT6419417.1 glycosyl transferase family protein [Gammaproteobacteria bacterium]MBT6575704.1 glycosyl transferase family protein [Gammaproteobacteria bacterium]MBT7434645.1 glycosyl transferase family protein [Gammaproteobacteria bacterium]